MALPSGAVTASFQLGEKGRVVLPAAVRRAAHIPDGATVVAHAAGEGRIVIETVDAIRARVWGAAPEPSDLDAAADVRAMRDEDNRTTDEAAERRSAAAADAGEGDAGARLLAHLGL
jgi:bifunctional DNA-binding transcriptional regulator/antitoxin component of YhaV-PrlF toxin-antitoxin module